MAASGNLIAEFIIPSWLDGWDLRKSITLAENNGEDLFNYQIKFDVNYGAGSDSGYSVYCDSKCKTDFGDIRFTDGLNTLDYWIEEKTDSDDASIWVEVPYIPLSGATIIYIYYGNASASDAGDGEETFPIFDDFPGTSLNTTLWTESLNGWTRSVSGGELHLTQGSGTLHYQLDSKVAFDLSNTRKKVIYNLNAVTLPTGQDTMAYRVVLEDRAAGFSVQGMRVYPEGIYDRYVQKQNHNEFWAGANKGAVTGVVRHEYQYNPVGDTFRAIASGARTYNDLRTDATDWATYTAFLNLLVGKYPTNPQYYFRSIFVAEFVPSEPTISAYGDEEGQTSTDLFSKFQLPASGSVDLFADFEVQHPGSQDLFAKFEVALQDGSNELLAKFEVGQNSADLYAKLSVTNADTADLFADFIIIRDETKDLYSKFTVQQSGSANLYARFLIQKTGTADLSAEFVVQQSGSADLKGVLEVKNASSADLFTDFTIIRDSTADFKGQFLVEQPSINLDALMQIRQSRTRDLRASFIVINTTETLFSKFELRRSTSAEFDAEFISRHSSSEEFQVEATIRHDGSQGLKGVFTVQHSGSSTLFAYFVVQPYEDLYARFKVLSLAKNLPKMIIDSDIKHWINYVFGTGDAFIEMPTITNDSSDKVTGDDSVKLDSGTEEHKYEAIKFGWVSAQHLAQVNDPAPCCPITDWNIDLLETWDWEDAVYLYPSIPLDTMIRLKWNVNFGTGGWTFASTNYGTSTDLRVSMYQGYYPGEIPSQYHYNDETAVLRLSLPSAGDLPPLTRLAWARLELYRHAGTTGGIVQTKRIPECSAIPQTFVYWNVANVIGGCDPYSVHGGAAYSSTGSQPMDIWTVGTLQWIYAGRWNLKMGGAFPYMGNSGFRTTPEDDGVSWDNGEYENFPFTALLKGWLQGTYENNGLFVEMSADAGWDYTMNLTSNAGPRFYSWDNGSNRPRFRLQFWPAGKQAVWVFGDDQQMEINEATQYNGSGALTFKNWAKSDYVGGGIATLNYVTTKTMAEGKLDTMLRFNSQQRKRIVAVDQRPPNNTPLVVETTPVNNEFTTYFRRSDATNNYNLMLRPGALTSQIRKGTTVLATFSAGFVVGDWYRIRLTWAVDKYGVLHICVHYYDDSTLEWIYLGAATDSNNLWPEGGDVRFETQDVDLDDTGIWEPR